MIKDFKYGYLRGFPKSTWVELTNNEGFGIVKLPSGGYGLFYERDVSNIGNCRDVFSLWRWALKFKAKCIMSKDTYRVFVSIIKEF